MQAVGIFEMAAAERAGLPQNGDDLVLSWNEVHEISLSIGAAADEHAGNGSQQYLPV